MCIYMSTYTHSYLSTLKTSYHHIELTRSHMVDHSLILVVCCIVLQCACSAFAVCLQCVCSVLQCVAVRCSALQCVAVRLQRVAVC